MHNHECRYCGEYFHCEKGADECFADLIVCEDCQGNEFFQYAFLMVLLVAAILLTVTFFKLIQI